MEGKSSEEAETEVKQLRLEAGQREKQVEDLKAGLQQRRAEAEQSGRKMEELGAALEARKRELEEKNGELERMRSELEELNGLLEEKSREADESVEKYCTLMVEVHKLEEANDALTTRLEQLANNAQHRRSARKSPSKRQGGNAEDDTENVAPSTPRASPSSSGKRSHRDIGERDGVQEALHNLTKKIKANVATTPRPRPEQEDEEFRPEGLPELVRRGV